VPNRSELEDYLLFQKWNFTALEAIIT